MLELDTWNKIHLIWSCVWYISCSEICFFSFSSYFVLPTLNITYRNLSVFLCREKGDFLKVRMERDRDKTLSCVVGWVVEVITTVERVNKMVKGPPYSSRISSFLSESKVELFGYNTYYFGILIVFRLLLLLFGCKNQYWLSRHYR